MHLGYCQAVFFFTLISLDRLATANLQAKKLGLNNKNLMHFTVFPCLSGPSVYSYSVVLLAGDHGYFFLLCASNLSPVSYH